MLKQSRFMSGLLYRHDFAFYKIIVITTTMATITKCFKKMKLKIMIYLDNLLKHM